MDLIDRINAAHLELSRLHFAGEGFKATGLCFVAGELHARLAIADLLRRWAPRRSVADVLKALAWTRDWARGHVLYHALGYFTRWTQQRIVAAERQGNRDGILEALELHSRICQARNLARIETENYSGDSSAERPTSGGNTRKKEKETIQ